MEIESTDLEKCQFAVAIYKNGYESEPFFITPTDEEDEKTLMALAYKRFPSLEKTNNQEE